MNESLLMELLKKFLTKEALKKIAGPLVDELFQALANKAKESQTPVDDVAVAALARACKEIIASL